MKYVHNEKALNKIARYGKDMMDDADIKLYRRHEVLFVSGDREF